MLYSLDYTIVDFFFCAKDVLLPMGGFTTKFFVVCGRFIDVLGFWKPVECFADITCDVLRDTLGFAPVD